MSFEDSKVRVTPSALEIPPLARRSFSVSLESSTVEIVSETLKIAVEDGRAHFLHLHGNVQKPGVALKQQQFELGELSAGLSSPEHTVTLLNYSNLSAAFKWDAGDHTLAIHPAQGCVPPRSALSCTFTATVLLGGRLDRVFGCDIEGQDFPLAIQLTGQVQGLEVLYLTEECASSTGPSLLPPSMYNPAERSSFLSATKLLSPEHNLLCLDFGNANIGEAKTLKFIMKNCSGLTTHFQLKAERFEPALHEDQLLARKQAKEAQALQFQETSGQQAPPRIRFATSADKKKRGLRAKLPPLLSDVHEQQNKFSTKGGETFTTTRKLGKSQHFYLSNNLGLAFVCEPRKGVLGPHSEVTVAVTVYNDICGRFEDVLVSTVQGLAPFKVPVKIRVRGSPLQLAPNQLGVDYKQEPPLLNFGSVSAGKEPLSRQIKLFNSGPKEVSLHWAVYNYSDLARRQDDIFNVALRPTGLANSSTGDLALFDVKFNVLEPQATPCPFSVSPTQVKIAGRKYQTFTIQFANEFEESHEAVIIAHPSLEDGTRLGDMGVVLRSQSIIPWLYLDKVERADSFFYVTFDAVAVGAAVGTKEINLVNRTPSTLRFTAAVENGPFLITSYRNSASVYLQDYEGGTVADLVEQLKLKRTSSNAQISRQKHTLAPENTLQLTVKFLKPNPNDHDAWPEAPKFTHNGGLLIHYASGAKQEIKLQGRLYRPQIILNSEHADEFKELTEQDFGVVPLSENQKISLYLSNLSMVQARWKLSYMKYPVKQRVATKTMTAKEREDNKSTDDPGVFKFSVAEGVLCGPTAPHRFAPCGPALPRAVNEEIVNYPVHIQVMFRPTADKLYKSKYTITVQGGSPVAFVLKGQGSS